MATLIRKHPLLAYYVLTFTLSWGGFVLMIGPSSLVNTNWQTEGKFLLGCVKRGSPSGSRKCRFAPRSSRR